MFSLTRNALEQFDNQHDFERMAADILNAIGCTEVVPIAPRGGSDDGKDITFTTESGKKGLACVTLRQDIGVKFKQDFSQRKANEYEKYAFFCTAHLTAKQKRTFIKFCANTLQAELVIYDIEALRSLLDSSLVAVKDRYLNLRDHGKSEKQIAENVITFLENRRVLYDPIERRDPKHCISSVLVIRDYLEKKLEDLDRNSELAKQLRTMQLRCREFLDSTQKLNSRLSVPHGNFDTYVFSKSLRELQEAFGFCLFQITLTYRLHVEGKLTSILPTSEN